jgi:hypothetical protein
MQVVSCRGQQEQAEQAMSVIGAMPSEEEVRARQPPRVSCLSMAISSRRCGLKMAKLKDGSLWTFYWAT